MEPIESKEERNRGYLARLHELTRVMNVYGAISRETKKFILRLRSREPEELETLALMIVGWKMDWPEAKTLNDLYANANERRLYGRSYTPPEVKALDDYLKEQFGKDFGEEE